MSKTANLNQPGRREPLAIVGVGCRLPGGVRNAESFWKLLIEGRSGITEIPEDRWNVERFYHPDVTIPGRMITKWGGFVEHLKSFDAAFWGISPREATRMDPQQRWLLEAAWEAIEDAGTAPSSLRQANVGVFVGISSNDYGSLQLSDYARADVHTNSGGTLSIAANRISYLFDLKGPSVSVDTACSSALVAISLACKAVWSGDCDAALAGGVNALITPHASIGFSKATMLSPSGKCYAFDERADGYVRSEGAGLIYVKPLSQALASRDPIYAVIRSAVVNQDGHTSSMTVPGVESQSAMLRLAYREAGIAPSQVAYVEAHGTGTPVGDPIETTALGNVLAEGRAEGERCLIGSVKTNIGHLESGSGIAGLIKATLVLHRDMVPPSLNFQTPNPNIPFTKLKLEVADQLRPLPHSGQEPPVAAVNSFGFGGTNAHVVLQAAPPRELATPAAGDQADRPFVLPISARDDVALRSYAKAFRKSLEDESLELADFCYSAGARKEHHAERLVVAGRNARELGRRLDAWLRGADDIEGVLAGRAAPAGKPIVFVFTGQGAQWWGMGRQLLQREPTFRQTIEKIDSLFQKISGWSILEEMTRPEEESRINQTNIAQPAIFALQVALAELWQSWGIKPSRVIGHSVGEVAAAYCAGIFSLEDAARLIYHRSRLQDTTAGHGKMLAAGITAAQARDAIGDLVEQVQLAAINGPDLVTLAGDTQPLEMIAAKLEQEGRFVRWLRVNYAFHTHQMDPIKQELIDVLSGIQPQAGHIPFVSTVTGEVHPGERLDARYWWHNVRQPVLFGPAISSLIASGESLFLELGPHPALQSSISACFAAQGSKGAIYHSLARKTDESLEMLTNLAGLHLTSVAIDWAAVNQSPGNFIRLPSYPWHYETYWLDAGHMATRTAPTLHPLLGSQLSAAQPTWQFALDPRLFPFLEDHRIWDGIVFPAAGYGEIGFAVAREMFPDEPYVVEELEATKALFVSEDAVPTVQVVFDHTDKSFRVYSSIGDKEWELNARGRLVLCPADTAAPLGTDLAKTRSSLADRIDHERYYAELHAMGYGFGPCFSEIAQIWLCDGQSLAEIVVPEPLTQESGQYHFHPAVLDACFQATLGSGDVAVESSAPEFFFLPESIRRIQVYQRELPKRLWAHARRRSADGKSIESDILVYDDQGQRFADILGFRVAKVEHKRGGDDVENCLYQFRWEPRRLRGSGFQGSCQFPNANELIAQVRQQASDVYAGHELSDYYTHFAPQMQRIVQQFIHNACVQLGWDFAVGDRFDLAAFVDRLGIIPEHHRLARAELGWLEVDGLLQRDGDQWQVLRQPVEDLADRLSPLAQQFPRFASEVALVQATGPRLAEVLSGQIDPLELLFPGGSNELLESFYTQGGDFPAFNRLIQVAVAKAAKALPPRRAIRVMEVGAGTGSLTRDVLQVLPADSCEYLFTDIGPAFVAAAKKQFADHAGMDYQTFDAEREPQLQNVPRHSLDLILATNVLHATADLKQTLANLRACLAPGGMLIFLEVVRRRPVWDNLFGLLKGWWRYTDEDLRRDSPLLERTAWESLLQQSGFHDVQSFICSADERETEQSVFVAFGPDAVEDLEQAEVDAGDALNAENDWAAAGSQSEASTPPTIVFCDEQGFADRLVERLSSDGNQVIRLRKGAAFRQISPSEYALADGAVEELLEVFQSALILEHGLRGIVHCWSLDNETADRLQPDALVRGQRNGVLGGLSLAQALSKLDLPSAPRVHFVTRAAQAVVEEDAVAGIAASPLVGFLRVANNEAYQHHWTLVDLDEQRSEFEIDDLCEEILIGDVEHEIAFRGGRRYVNRLQRVRLDELPDRQQNAVQSDGSVLPYRLQTRKPGTLANLTLNETPRRDPGPHEIEVRVQAGGINFRDLMKALGMYPGNPVDLLWFGDDFCGTIERVGSQVTDLQPGDDVAGMAPYAFRSHLTVDHRLVFKRPAGMSFEESATLPTVFLTAHFALNYLARMQPQEKILIHAGTGGVGQAAIQIAQHLGLEIFATAGTPHKRQLLRDMGVPHVMNSRTLEFADQVLEITEGRGVDAVLNSLAGEFVPKSLSILAPFGRFLEIGKIDVYGNTKLGLAALKDNISYYVIDLAQVLTEKPECVVAMYQALTEQFASGAYGPLPHQVFPITECVDAFRFMAQGKHVGKNVLSFDQSQIPIAPCSQPGCLLRPDASYLITGGAGGFGLEVAKWMAAQGARHLVLMSRSGPGAEAAAEIAKLQATGVDVRDVRGDVTRPEDVRRVVDHIQAECPPLKGVIHGAMVLDDEFIVELDEGRFNRVLHPKMIGAWNLHMATRELPLEHFISFSSISAVFGATKQSNYNAGNCFLDALARHRHAQGLPSLTLNWGAILGAGFVERNRKTAEYLDKIGLKPLQVHEALEIFGDLIQKASTMLAVARVDWQQLGKLSAAVANLPMYAPVAQENTQNRSGVSFRPRLMAAAPSERAAMVEDFLAEQVAGVFGIETAKVDRDASLTNLGLDSLMAVELMNRVEAELGMNIPMGGVLSGPNVKELAQTVLGLFVESTDAAEAVTEESGRSTGGLAPLQSLDVHLDRYPLTAQQRAVWSECQRQPQTHGNVSCAAVVRPRVDADKLRAAYRSISERHAMLRTSLIQVDEDWMQHVQARGQVAFSEVDATDLPAQQLSQLIAERVNRPFDLAAASLARVEILRRDAHSDVILLCAHPAIADAWSMTVLLRDLCVEYQALCTGEASVDRSPAFSYEDYARWEEQLLASDAAGHTLDYWVEQLDGAPAEVQLPTDRPRQIVEAAHEASFPLELDDELTLSLLALSAEQTVPLRVTMFAAYALLLHARAKQPDLLVGFRFDGRTQPALSDTVGLFENWLPTRCQIESNQSFCDFLAQTRRQLASGFANQQVPIARLLERLDFHRSGSEQETTGKSLVQVAFAMPQAACVDDSPYALFQVGRSGHAMQLRGLSIESVDVLPGTLEQRTATRSPSSERNGAAFRMGAELGLELAESSGRMLGWWHYNSNLFDVTTISQLNADLRQILRQLVANPKRPISQLLAAAGFQLTGDAASAAESKTRRVTLRVTADSADIDFDREYQLDASITPAGPAPIRAVGASQRFLTGATGFIGAHLLSELLERTDSEIVCLVRARDEAEGQQRIRDNLAAYGLQPLGVAERVRVVVGDFSKPLFGLSQAEFDRLASEIDVVYHNGADVNLVLPYEALRTVNVYGTREVLRLACHMHTKPTHMVSTFTVHTTEATRGRLVTETDPLPPCEELLHGYSQTKWVSEKMIGEARERGLPVTIYRPGHVTGDSRTGAANTNDLLHTFVLVCLRLGMAPLRDVEMDITPVDYVAQAIAELSLQTESLGKCFHLTNPQALQAPFLVEWMEEFDMGIQRVPYDTWRDRVFELAEQMNAPELKLLGDILGPRVLAGDQALAVHPRFDCQQALDALAHTNIRCAPPDRRLLTTYSEFLQRMDADPATTADQAAPK